MGKSVIIVGRKFDLVPTKRFLFSFSESEKFLAFNLITCPIKSNSLLPVFYWVK